MKQLEQEISEVVEREYARAAEKFGAVNSSDHESYAVILEEYEEADYENERFANMLAEFWGAVKQNRDDDKLKRTLLVMEDIAVLAAAEYCQVAAMCHKAIKTIEGKE